MIESKRKQAWPFIQAFKGGGRKEIKNNKQQIRKAPPIKLKYVLSKRPSLLGDNEATRNSEQCDIKR
jgi:hypothetical protein